MSASQLPNANTRRLRAIHRRLVKRFGELAPPRAADPLDELVLTVLSQHTSDLNRDRAFEGLVSRLRKGIPTEQRDRIVRGVSYTFAFLILGLVLWQLIGPRI